jgi:Fic family protein
MAAKKTRKPTKKSGSKPARSAKKAAKKAPAARPKKGTAARAKIRTKRAAVKTRARKVSAKPAKRAAAPKRKAKAVKPAKKAAKPAKKVAKKAAKPAKKAAKPVKKVAKKAATPAKKAAKPVKKASVAKPVKKASVNRPMKRASLLKLTKAQKAARRAEQIRAARKAWLERKRAAEAEKTTRKATKPVKAEKPARPAKVERAPRAAEVETPRSVEKPARKADKASVDKVIEKPRRSQPEIPASKPSHREVAEGRPSAKKSVPGDRPSGKGRSSEASSQPGSREPSKSRRSALQGGTGSSPGLRRPSSPPLREPPARLISLPLPILTPTKRPSIEERAAQIDERLIAASPEFKRRYEESLDMSWIYHDSALEGVVYTFEELRTALSGQAPPMTDSSLQPTYDDIRRHKEAIEHVREYALNKKMPITIDVIRKLYLILHPEEGDIKTVKYRKDIPQHRLYFHEYAPPDKIAYKVRQIVDWLNDPETRKTRNGIRIAARAHYDLLRVYPFATDSGKVSRLFMNLLLIRSGLPPSIIHSTERQRYYEALKGSATTVLQMGQEAVENALASVEKLLDEYETKKRAFVS